MKAGYSARDEYSKWVFLSMPFLNGGNLESVIMKAGGRISRGAMSTKIPEVTTVLNGTSRVRAATA